jgi:hypothetical protein
LEGPILKTAASFPKGLKGRNMIARGEAPGYAPTNNQALKGRHNSLIALRWIKLLNNRTPDSSTQLPLSRGRIEPMNLDTTTASVSLSSPKGGEGWGEEGSGLKGKFHWFFGVRRSMFDVRCSPVHGKGRGEGKRKLSSTRAHTLANKI